MIIALILILLIGVYLFCLSGRTGHPGLAEFRRWRYAHRGLHDADRPENSMAAFRAAADSGFGIEFDLHLMRDGNLAVIHDSALLRTTGKEGKIEDLTAEQLADYPLGGTDETIPQFRQVLELYRGRAPLIIELKSDGDNYAELTQTACKMMEGYSGSWCMESFDPRCVRWLRENRPDIIRGQLSENFLKSGSGGNFATRLALTAYLTNWWNRPDFIAYRFADRKNLSCILCRKVLGLQGVSWTIRSAEQLEQAEKEGWLPIFEGFRP